MHKKTQYCLRMAKSAFQAQLSSIMGIMTESAMKQICEIVDNDFAYLRLELTRALNENAALSDKMHALEGEVEILRNAKNESRKRSKKCRSICIQTLEVSDLPSINGIFGKEWCSSLWDRKEPRTDENADPLVPDEPNDNSKLLTIKEENCEKEVCPGNSNKAVVTRRKNPAPPSNHSDILEVNLDDDKEGEEKYIYVISAGFVETPEVHPIPSVLPGADSPKIICMVDTAENVIVPSSNHMEFDEHCIPIEFIAGEHTSTQPCEEQEKVTPQDTVKDAGKGSGGGQIFRCFDGFRVHEQPQSEEKLKAMPRCSECSRVFSRQSSLTLHKKCHQKQNLYKCHKCKVIFHQKNLLRSHKCLLPKSLAKTSGQRFRCEQCGKYLHSRANLRVHYAVHTGEKPHRCSYCGRGFSQKGNLNTHERIHKGERPFICLTCGKSFTQKVNLKQHWVVHSRMNKSKAKKNTEKSL